MADLKLGVDSSGAQKGFNDATKASNSFLASVQKATAAARDFASGFKSGVVDEFRKQLGNGATPAVQQFQQQVQKADQTSRGFVDTLTRRFVTGYAITQLRAVAQQLGSINAEIARTGDLAGRTQTDSGVLQGLIGAAGEKGIDPSAFLDGFFKLNQQIELAKHGSGDLLTVFRANNVAIGDAQGTFLKISDLIKNSRDDTTKLNILQAAGLPTSEAFVRLMEQGATAIQKAADNVPKLTQAQIDAARELDKEFNKTWANIEQYGKSAFVSIGSVFASTIRQDIEDVKRVAAFFQSLPGFANKYNAAIAGGQAPLQVTIPVGDKITPQRTSLMLHDTGSPTKNPFLDEAAVARYSQVVSLLGDLANVQELVKAKTGELNVVAVKNNLLTRDQISAIVEETRLKAEAAVGSAKLSVGLATERDIHNQVMASLPASIRLIAERTQAVQKNTEALEQQNAVAAAALPQLKTLELQSASVRGQLDALGVGITGGITNPLVDMASGATKAGDAFKQMGLNVIRAIEQMIVNMTIAAPIARGLMSILGGFVPGAGASASVGVPTGLGAIYANGGVQSGPGISAFSNQIVDKPTIFPFAKGIGLMGEAGAEAIMPLTRIGGKLGVRAEGGTSNVVNVSFGDIHLPDDPSGKDPTGAGRASVVAKAVESSVRSVVRDELIKAQRPRGALNRASSI